MEQIIQSFVHAFGWSIIHSLWQGGLVYVVLFIVFSTIPKLPPATKHNLSYISLGAIFIWFTITFIQQWTYTAASPIAFYYQPLSSVAPTSLNIDLAFLERVFPAITLLYFTGFVLNSVILLKGYLIIHKLRSTGLQGVPAEWQNVFYKNIARLNIRRKVAFHISTIVKVPAAIGYLKPVILFPVSLCTSLTPVEVEAILIHELTHIKRNDYLLNQIKSIIDILLFFNPFVWLIGRFIQTERENICDDMVLKSTSNPVTYAETLLKIEALQHEYYPSHVMRINGHKNYLFNRIKRITNMKTKSINSKQQLAGITVIILAICCIAWLVPSKEIKHKVDNHVMSELSHPQALNPVALPAFIATDTIIEPKKKSKVKIIVTDPEGSQKEYNSISEIPDSLKKDMNIFPGDFNFIADSLKLYGKELANLVSKTFNSPEFLKQQQAISEQFNSPEFKKAQKEIAEGFNSPEFKRAQKEIAERFNSVEFKNKMKEITEKFNSAEFKKRQEDLMKKLNSTEFKERQKEILKKQKELLEKINSPEFKQQQEELIKKQEELMKKMNSTELQKKQSQFPEIHMKLQNIQGEVLNQKAFTKPENRAQAFL